MILQISYNASMEDKKHPSEKLSHFEFKSLSYDPTKPRNVADYLKWLTDEDAKKYLAGKRLNFGVLIMNLLFDNNAGNIVRSANAFGTKEIILYGHKKFDRRSSVGAEFYSHFRHIKFVEDLDAVLAEYDLVVGVENTESSVPLEKFEWDKNKKTLIIFGQESAGIPDDVLKKCDAVISISQRGSVRSLNVAVAAGIVMHDYANR